MSCRVCTQRDSMKAPDDDDDGKATTSVRIRTSSHVVLIVGFLDRKTSVSIVPSLLRTRLKLPDHCRLASLLASVERKNNDGGFLLLNADCG